MKKVFPQIFYVLFLTLAPPFVLKQSTLNAQESTVDLPTATASANSSETIPSLFNEAEMYSSTEYNALQKIRVFATYATNPERLATYTVGSYSAMSDEAALAEFNTRDLEDLLRSDSIEFVAITKTGELRKFNSELVARLLKVEVCGNEGVACLADYLSSIQSLDGSPVELGVVSKPEIGIKNASEILIKPKGHIRPFSVSVGFGF